MSQASSLAEAPPVAISSAEAKLHDSARKHVTGEARYIDDLPEAAGTLHLCFGLSPHAHARIGTMDLSAARAAPGVVAVLTAKDIPAINDVSMVAGDDPLFAVDRVEYDGQAVFAVIAKTALAARHAARLAQIDYQPLPAIVDVDQAMAAESYLLPPRELVHGNPQKALEDAKHRLQGTFYCGGQEHFYLEGQVALAIPGEDNDFFVHSSTQHPGEVQHTIAKVLGLADHAVTVETRRMGGAFGGKETQANIFAAAAALGAWATGAPVKVRPDRDDDMRLTGKRHDFRIRYDVGFDDQGRILGLDIELAARGGYSIDATGAVSDRAIFHVDNCYHLPHVRIASYRCKTHTVSNTAFRGFGGPQSIAGTEHLIEHIAHTLGLDPLAVRRINFYGKNDGKHDAKNKRNLTPYGMTVTDNVIHELTDELVARASYQARREEIAAFNAENSVLKRGLSLTPVKFGIAFTTATFFNQAGALLHLYNDGSLHLNHGGTEMGQGLFVKVAQVVARAFAVELDQVKITATNTAKVPNASPTAASSGSDLNGMAALNAAEKIKQRLIAHAAERYGVPMQKIAFRGGGLDLGGEKHLPLAELAKEAYQARVPLSATGFYKTPKIDAYDAEKLHGPLYHYFAYGVSIAEALVDTLTGEYRFPRIDILHDVGRSLNPAVDRGQVEGGYLQGLGWLTMEELWWDEKGQLGTHAPSTYKIPACSDLPTDFRVHLWERGYNTEETVFRSKAVGEPPLMLAASALGALADAVTAAGDGRYPDLHAPATPERVLQAIEKVTSKVTSKEGAADATQHEG